MPNPLTADERGRRRLQYLLFKAGSLDGIELRKLNEAANLRRDLRVMIEQWVEAEVEARLCAALRAASRWPSRFIIPAPKPAKVQKYKRPPRRYELPVGRTQRQREIA